jgi:Family of unknown function (DUF6318)
VSAGVQVAVALAGLAVISGCSSDAAPTPAPEPRPSTATPAPTPSTTATPREHAPELPARAHGRSEKAIRAFVAYYIDLVNYAARTGDTRLLRKYSGNECVSCMNLVNLVEDTYNAGGRIESAGVGI